MSLPLPPEGILDPDLPWSRLRPTSRLWILLKARLTGRPTEEGHYSSYVNVSDADADKIIENLKKDPRGYPSVDQTSGHPGQWMERERLYQEWLVDNYLNSTPIENVPVELEIINVEPKAEDTPIVVKVETPFEPANSPGRKRIRLKRIPNTIKKPDKKDLASRMAAAFDKRMEDLIDSIQRPPTPSSGNVKPQPKKKETVYRKKYRYSTKQNNASNFNEYLTNKIGSAFSLAAQARKEANDAGAPKQRAGFFVRKALTSEFGGDFLRRTRGTFSSDPAPYQDPALSRGDRFRSLISPHLQAPKVQQLSLDLESQKGSGIVVVNQVGLSATIKPVVKSLTDSYKDLLKKLDSVSGEKNTVISKKSQGTNLLESLSDQMVDLLESVKKSVGIKSKYVKTKQLTLNLKAEIAREEKAAQIENKLEQTVDSSGTIDTTKVDPGDETQFNIFGLVKNLLGLGGDDEDGPGGGGGSTGGGGLFDILDFGDDRRSRRRNRNTPRFGRTPRPGITPTAKGPGMFSRFKNFMGGKTAKNILGVGGLVAGAGVLGSALSGMGSGFAGGAKGALNIGKSAMGFLSNNPIASRLAMATGKFGGRMIPAAGTAFSAAEAADRAKRGDSIGAWLAGLGAASGGATVATSGAALTGWGAAIPAITEAASVVSDVGLFGYDIFNALTGRDPGSQPKKKMAEGGVMIGEAGPELVANTSTLGSLNYTGSINKTMSSTLGTILGTTSQVVEQIGPAAGAIRPYIENMINPLKKLFGSPTYTLGTSVGRGLSNIQKPKPDDDVLNQILKSLLNFISGREIDDPEVPTAPPPAMGQGTDFWTLAAIASMEDGSPQGQADVAQSVYNRVADGSYGKSVYEVLTADAQYQPAYNNPSPSSGINPLFKSITDLESAAAAVKDGTKRIHGRDITIDEARKKVQEASTNISNPTLQKNAAEFIQGRTDFTATGRGKGDEVKRPTGGNVFYWQYGTGKMRGQAAAPIPSMNSASPAGARPGDGTAVRAVGDSLAEGVAQNSGGSISDNATQSLSPDKVNTSLRNAGINRGNTGNVVLSTGLANNPSDRSSAMSQFNYLQQAGVPYTVLPISDQQNASILRRTGMDTNKWLRQTVPSKGGTVAPSYSAGSDGIHPTAAVYKSLGDAVRSNN